jgi:hypothetical protein
MPTPQEFYDYDLYLIANKSAVYVFLDQKRQQIQAQLIRKRTTSQELVN